MNGIMSRVCRRPRPERVGSIVIPLVLAFSLLLTIGLVAQTALRTPEQAFGFRVGADRQLVNWTQLTGYLTELSKASDKLRIIDIGRTTMGKPLIAAVVSSRDNIARLDRYREIVRELADPRATSPEAAARLASEGKVIIAIGCSNHAAELGAAQMSAELVHYLLTDDSPRTRRILDDVVFLLFPSMNPDGMDLIVDWYTQTLGKPWEGGQMPWLYNKYVGHDINRDFFMLNQIENRHFAKVFYEDWHPQVFLTMHQMGNRGPRLFVPPNYEPVDPNYEPLIWREAGLLGHAMATELEARGMKGVITNAMYDYYFPGYEDSGPLGHNTVCLLTEAASARLASPMTVGREDLTGTPKGLPEYGVQQNHPNPWPGGTWRLRDIVEYEFHAALGLLDASAKYREELLQNFYQMGKNQVEKGRTEPPFAFVVPALQRDPLTTGKMINILRMAAIEAWKAKAPFEADGRRYDAGSYVILMEQPYRAYAKTLLERQKYPARRLFAGGPPERPYDVAGWTLPLQMGVDTVAIQRRFEFEREPVDRVVPAPVTITAKGAALVLPPELNDSFIAANRILKDGGAVLRATSPIQAGSVMLAPGAFIVPLDSRGRRSPAPDRVKELSIPAQTLATMPAGSLMPLRAPRIGLYKPWTASMDEGWTRWLFEQFEFPFVNLLDADVRAGGLENRFDVIVLPSTRDPQSIIEGNRPGTTAPEYAGGIGTEGVTHLREFVERGGTLVALGGSTQFAIEQLALPVRDALAGVRPDTFFCPGSIVRTVVDPTHPVGFGMPADSVAVFQFSPAFDVTAAFGTAQPRIVVKYPEAAILLSGWMEGERTLANKAAVVDVPVARGRVILFGFGVQARAQPHATFKLLFNALYYAVPPSTEKPAPVKITETRRRSGR